MLSTDKFRQLRDLCRRQQASSLEDHLRSRLRLNVPGAASEGTLETIASAMREHPDVGYVHVNPAGNWVAACDGQQTLAWVDVEQNGTMRLTIV